MSTINIENLTFEYEGYYKPVFKNVNLNLNTHWKLGLVGRNGRGKTTLLKLIHGTLGPTEGKVVKSVETEVFPYEYDSKYAKTIDVLKNTIHGLTDIEIEMEACLELGTPEALKRYGHYLSRFLDLDGFAVESKIEKEVALMGLPVSLLERTFETLSGGERTKLLIACLFVRENHFILLDEPTNHLDIVGKEMLASYLNRKTGFIAVSHDRVFLDAVSDHILSINKGDVILEKGNYSSWEQNRNLTNGYEIKTRDKILREVKDLEKAARNCRTWSYAKEAEKKGAMDKGFVGARAARMMKRAKHVERRRNELLDEKKMLLRNYEKIDGLKIIQNASESELVHIQDLCFGYDGQAILQGLTLTVKTNDRLWIRGANGSGKSTLIHLLTGRLEPTAGIIKYRANLKISESFQEPLWKCGYLKEYIKEAALDETVFRTVLASFDMQQAFFERPLETFSQGELKKIDIARAVTQENHLLILDEPLNYMDIQFREQLEQAILSYQLTVVFVEHDGYFGQRIATEVIDFG